MKGFENMNVRWRKRNVNVRRRKKKREH